jgi:hypothetical protein
MNQSDWETITSYLRSKPVGTVFTTKDWFKNGKEEIMVSQPYGLSLESLRETLNFCDKHNLDLEIDAGGWHYPHNTLLVTIKKRQTK